MANEQKTVAEKISAFINDPDIRLFEERFKQTTDMFEAMGIARAENPHSDFIAWIFDSKRNPNLGVRPTQILLHFLAKNSLEKCELSLCKGSALLYSKLLVDDFNILSTECRREFQTFGQEKDGRIDILISCDIEIGKAQKRLNIVVENKIESDTHDNQLDCYYRFITRIFPEALNFFVLLAPTPESLNERHSAYIPMSYQALNDNVFQPLLNDEKTSIRAKVLIEEYLHTLSRIEDKKKIRLLAMKETDRNILLTFYEKHGELIYDMLNALNETLPSEERKKVSKLLEPFNLIDEILKSRKLSYKIDGIEIKYLSDFAKEVAVRYVDKHPDVTFENLKETFKAVDGMVNPKPFINTTDLANDGRKRWKDTEREVKKSDGTTVRVYTSSQWTSDTIKIFEAFVRFNIAPDIGINIERVENNISSRL